MGFQPHLPVNASDFADPDIRRRWREEQNMQVFSLRAPAREDLVIDLFCDLPFDFENEWEQALETTLGPDFPPCRIVSLSTLRAMIRLASARSTSMILSIFPMSDSSKSTIDPWKAATFAGASEMRAQTARAMTIHERFIWFDEMDTLCRYQAEQRGDPPPSMQFDRRQAKEG